MGRLQAETLDVEEEISQRILHEAETTVWALILPGLWGADALVDFLAGAVPVLRVDGNISDRSPGWPIWAALRNGDHRGPPPRDTAEGKQDTQAVTEELKQWCRSNDGTGTRRGSPIIVLDSPYLLDEVTVAILSAESITDSVRIVAIAAADDEVPDYLHRFPGTGSARTLTQRPLSSRRLDTALRRRLSGPISPTVFHRVRSLCGGHAILADRILKVAGSSGVLNRTGGLWTWEADASEFEALLTSISGDILGGFSPTERELLVLIAIADWIPKQWAVRHFGESTIRRLRSQSILRTDVEGSHGAEDLHIASEALRLIVLAQARPTEAARLWYSIGCSIPAQWGGPSSRAALIWWQTRVGAGVDPVEAEEAAAWGLTRARYNMVLDVTRGHTAQRPILRVYAARAHYAQGDVAAAIEAVAPLAHSTGATEETDSHVTRRALLLTERIAIFHPERVAELLVALRSLSPTGLTPDLDLAKEVDNQVDAQGGASAIARARAAEDCEERAVAQLRIGEQLGLRRHPDLGRLAISLLLDDLTREGGFPDIEESALALQLLITIASGWRTDVQRISMQIWRRRSIQGQALPAVAGLITAMMSMQQDRMGTAFQHASVAYRTFSRADPFGLLPLSTAMAAATASFVNAELSRAAHRRHQRMFGEGPLNYGVQSLRQVAAGLGAVGSGPPTAEVSRRLVGLASAAREQGDWVQEQQLLLLAALGWSEEAAQTVLQAPWRDDLGRPRMIRIHAEALLSPSAEHAVDAAETLINSDASYLGLVILSALWTRLGHIDHESRTRIVTLVIAAKRRSGEGSWLLDTFTGLILDDRETQVLRALHAGHTTRSISELLAVSPRTVESVISGLLRRFCCSNRVELMTLDLLQD